MQSNSNGLEPHGVSTKQQEQSCTYQNNLSLKLRLIRAELLHLPQTRIYPGRNGTCINWYYAHVPGGGEPDTTVMKSRGRGEHGSTHTSGSPAAESGKCISDHAASPATAESGKRISDHASSPATAESGKKRTSCHADRYISKRSTPELPSMVNAEALRQMLEVYADELEAYKVWCEKKAHTAEVCDAILDREGAYYKYLFPGGKAESSNKAIRYIANSVIKLNALESWGYEEYRRSGIHPEGLIHPTLKGDKVRSKSEALIADTLFERHIPYRYECERMFEGVSLHPDFTILHPESGKIVYWEHLGKMDDPEYVHKNADRLVVLAKNGILPSKNLIISSETRQSPLSKKNVCDLIDAFLSWDEMR